MKRRGFLSLVGSAAVGGCVGARTTNPPPDPVREFTATAPWPMAGYDAAGTGQNGDSEPLQNQAEAWRHDLTNGAVGSVDMHLVTDSETVYAAAANRMSALIARDGSHRWSETFHLKTVSGLAVFDDELFVTATGPSGPILTKRDTETGEKIWTRMLDSSVRGPPVVTEDQIVVITAAPEGGVSSFGHDGDLEWRHDIVARNDGPRAALAGDSVFVTDGGELLALEAKTGDVRWRRRLETPLTQPPVVADGRVYATTASGMSVFETDSEVVWERTLGKKQTFSCPCVLGDSVVIANEAGHITALDKADGELSWRALLSGSVTSPLAAAGDQLVLTTESGSLTAHEAGSARWSRELSLRERLDSPVQATLVPAHDRLYVGLNDGWVYALG